MLKRHFLKLIILFCVTVVTIVAYNHTAETEVSTTTTRVISADSKNELVSEVYAVETIPDRFVIDVPYVSEAPEGDWSGDWVNACEEATIAMVEKYYEGVKSVSVLEAKNYLQNLFDEENRLYGSNKNTDANQILELINLHSKFDARIVTNPTIDEIKREIINKRPVISLHRGFDLKNPNIPFSPIKSSYHTVVVVGYDDVSQEFITHDPGDEVNGVNHRYSYTDFMFSLHDYNKETDKTDGVPTVLFTKEQ